MQEWNNFYIASAGASSALLGLIFVCVSISLTKILAFKTLPNRAIVSLTLLLCILIVSLLSLVPGQHLNWAGYELLFAGIILWAVITRIDFKNYKQIGTDYKLNYLLLICLDQFAILPYIIGGIITLSVGEIGFFWVVAAIIFSFIKSILDAWVLLVEINR